MNTKLLRQKILDLAIHGKLVPQDPNDEPASVLLERIKAEKERLVKEGKIKKSKKSSKASDTPHYENVPFAIPDSWCWVRGKDIFLPMESTKPTGTEFTYIDLDAVDNESNTVANPKKLLVTNAPSRATRKLHYNDIVFSMVRPYLRNVALVPKGLSNAIGSTGFYVISPYSDVNREYMFRLLLSNYVIDGINAYMKGDNSPSINNSHIENYLYPMPPVKEQGRIVAEIERWFSLIDIIESSKEDLQSTIKQAKSKILDLAIHGKLVPQDPNDEPALELLKRINPKAEITCDNAHYPFEVPKGWLILAGESIFAPMKSIKPSGNSFFYADIDSIDNRLNVVRPKLVATSLAPSRASRYTTKEDVLFSMVRPYLHNIAMVEISNCIASTGFYVCHSNGSLLSKYCLYLMLSDYVVNGLNHFMKGDNSPSISKSHIDKFLYPLPPLPEQQRIVAKIEELFTILDNIQNSLEA